MTDGPFWIPVETEGRLATMARPRGGAGLESQLREFRAAGVTGLVSLLSREEQQGLDLSHEASACTELGLSFRSLPVPDFDIPNDETTFWTLARELGEDLRAGEVILIHCHGGVGRSSVLAAAVLTCCGHAAVEAFATIAAARGLPVPDTETQRAWLVDSATRRGAPRE